MSGRDAIRLSDEDRVLWNLVARSATPLRGRKGVPPPVEETVPASPEPPPTAGEGLPAARPKRQAVGSVIDRPTLDKLARGKLPIEGRVDLHGMTQGEAHGLLLSFLQRAQARGVRYVLVITGKGSSSGGDGVLRRAVPSWLSTAPFRPLVSSHDLASRHHGGSGALYVRLRRPAPPVQNSV